MIPKAGQILTPAQYGAVAPDGSKWPLNVDNRSRYAINKVYPTVQGEGAQVGMPMTIIRLQGCPVSCVFCDTPESWALPQETEWKAAADIAAQVADLPPAWALVTGGEPTWHDLHALTNALDTYNLKRALETSGVYEITGDWDYITVSPKPKGLLPANPRALWQAHEIKWLIGRTEDVKALEVWLEHWRRQPTDVFGPGQHWFDEVKKTVSLQPISCSPKATRICLDALMDRPDWRLSIQTHKMMGIA